MKLKQKLLLITGLCSLLTVSVATLVPSSAYADCGGAKTSIINCSQGNGKTVESNGIWGILLIGVNILTAGVGIVAVGGIVYGSILFASAGDRSDQVKKAVGIITNVVIGLVLYFLMFALTQFLIPGGIFS